MQKSVQKPDTENVLIAVALLALSDAIFKIFRENRRKETDMMDAVKSVSTIRNFMGNAGRNTCNEYLYEALKDADEALQRQIPQKTKEETFDKDMKIGHVVFKAGTKVHHCPECLSMVTCSNNFCNRCGQALIW